MIRLHGNVNRFRYLLLCLTAGLLFFVGAGGMNRAWAADSGVKEGELQIEYPPELEDPARHILWIGDSRTQGMALYVKKDVYCAAESADYKWLSGEGRAIVYGFLDRFKGDTVLLGLGINDLGHADKYIRFYKGLMRRYPGKHFCVLSIGPVNEATEAANGYSVTNEEIEDMNRKFQTAFPSQYLDIYRWLRRRGFESRDGVHYTPEVCRAIHIYVHLLVTEHRWKLCWRGVISRARGSPVSPPPAYLQAGSDSPPPA